jgi:hypothetical protein
MPPTMLTSSVSCVRPGRRRPSSTLTPMPGLSRGYPSDKRWTAKAPLSARPD